MLAAPRFQGMRQDLDQSGAGGQRRWFGEPFPPVWIKVFPHQGNQRFDSSDLASDDMVFAEESVVGQQSVGGVESVQPKNPLLVLPHSISDK